MTNLKINKRYLVRAAAGFMAVILALVVAACGGNSNDDSGAAAAGNGTDLAFVDDMVPHHTSAVDMAKIAQKRGQSSFVKKLADDIVRTQNEEIGVMKAAKRDLTKDKVKKTPLGVPQKDMGMDMKMNMDSLETANPFDKAFIDMMVAHHQAAIRMARVEMAKGKSENLMKLAQEIEAAQTREIKAMNKYRTSTFGAPSPAGGVPAGKKESGGGSGGNDMKGM